MHQLLVEIFPLKILMGMQIFLQLVETLTIGDINSNADISTAGGDIKRWKY